MSTDGSKYNFIYDKLVEDEDDILGIIAYSFYKRQKIEFVRNFKGTHGTDPSDHDLKVFHGLSNSDSAIESYKLKATTLAQEFLDEALGERVKEIEEESDRLVQQQIKAIKPAFWSGVIQNIVASVIFVLFIGAIVFISWSARLGITNAVEAAFDVKISGPTDTPPAEHSEPAP